MPDDLELTPDRAITAIHSLGDNLGFDRVRVDRSQRDRVWFEVGYGCGEILVRTSSGKRYRSDTTRVDLGAVADLLLELLDHGETIVHAQIAQREDAS